MHGAAGRRPPRDRPDARDQLAQPEGLHEIVVRTELEADHAIGLLAARGDDDDRHVGALAEAPADVEPVDVREPQVEQHEIGARSGKRLGPRRRAFDDEALTAKPLRERQRDRFLVFHEQDPHDRILAAFAPGAIGTWPNLYHGHSEPWRTALPPLTRRLLWSVHRLRRSLMKKLHVSLIALLLAIAAVVGTFAATRTASLGTSSRQASNAAYTAKVKQLNAFSARLRQELAAKPAQVQIQAPARAAVTPRVVYRRPPAIVVVKHTHHGDDGSERAGGGGND